VGKSGHPPAVVQEVSCSILLVSGSVRRASTNTAVLRTVQVDAASGTECVLYDELAELPHFNPDDDQHAPPPAVVRLRDAVHRADAILFSTPEYAGAMPGALKNLLEWSIGDDQHGSVYEKPVGWINCSARGARLTYESLRTVLEYAHARVIAEACGNVVVSGSSLGEDGLLSDTAARADVNRLVAALAKVACTVTRSR
jgi:NAD(P)H-dependent FMN reductase